MVSLISKRSQARNEKALQELISSVSGNGQCADCEARNPGWASWSLGIFLCVRCASLHRKLGTHISKVKSLSMDSWNSEQVETMKRVGNTTSNRTFNPKNVKPSIPVDVDEAEGVMERFIRQKYEQRAFVSGSQPAKLRAGSASSDDGHRPPLPPKPSKKFGFAFRSTSSAHPNRAAERLTPPLSPHFSGSSGALSQARTNKQSRVLGSTVGNQEDDFDAKLATLRDMGFSDSRRNSTILKSAGGNLDRAVEALVTIAESSRVPSGTITPLSAGSAAPGLTVEKRRPVEAAKGNPFDALDSEPQPLQQRSFTMPIQQSVGAQAPAAQQAYNIPQSTTPYFNYQDPSTLQQSFQSLQVSQPGQHSVSPANHHSSNPFLHPQQPQQPVQNEPAFFASTYQPQQYTQQPPAETTNPFLRKVQSQNFRPNPWDAQTQPQRVQSPATNPWEPQQHQQFTQTPFAESPMAYPQDQNGAFMASQNTTQTFQNRTYSGQNPFNSQPSASPAPFINQGFPQAEAQPESPWVYSPPQQSQPQYFQQNQQSPPPQTQSYQYLPPQQQQQQQNYPQSSQSPAPTPFRHDKSSILALYNQPQLTPQPRLESVSENQVQQQGPPQRSVTLPSSMSNGTSNPFGGASEQGYGMQAQQQQQAIAGSTQQDAFSWLTQR